MNRYIFVNQEIYRIETLNLILLGRILMGGGGLISGEGSVNTQEGGVTEDDEIEECKNQTRTGKRNTKSENLQRKIEVSELGNIQKILLLTRFCC